MDAGTKFLITTGGVAGCLSVLILYNYPQKYWIPLLFIIMGSAGTSALGGWYFFAD